VTRSAICPSEKSVCWRSGKATLSKTRHRAEQCAVLEEHADFAAKSQELGHREARNDCPRTTMSPESGNINPIMFLIQHALAGAGGVPARR